MTVQETEQLKRELDPLLDKLDSQDMRSVYNFVMSLVTEPASQTSTELLFTDEEVREMIKPKPKSGAEIIQAGLTGGWADEGIEDGQEYIKQQRARNKANNSW